MDYGKAYAITEWHKEVIKVKYMLGTRYKKAYADLFYRWYKEYKNIKVSDNNIETD